MNIVKQSFFLLKKNALVWLMCSLIDIVFLFAYGWVTGPVRFKIAAQTLELGKAMAQQGNTGVSGLFIGPASLATEKLVFLMIILAVLTYVLYVLFQGINWKIASDIAGKKKEWAAYLNGFAKVNILFFLLFIVFFALMIMASIRQTVLEAFGAAGLDLLGYAAVAGILVIAYFAVISYATLDVKKALKLGRKKNMLILGSAVFLYFFALNYVLVLLAKQSNAVMFLVGVVLFFPSVTWARVLIALKVK